MSYLANRQTNRQTKTGKNITSLAEVITCSLHTCLYDDSSEHHVAEFATRCLDDTGVVVTHVDAENNHTELLRLHAACLFLCLSVCLSRAGAVSKERQLYDSHIFTDDGFKSLVIDNKASARNSTRFFWKEKKTIKLSLNVYHQFACLSCLAVLQVVTVW